MDIETVQLCFEKYMNYLLKFENIKSYEHYDIKTITINDMDKLTQISFMDYVIKCEDKINQFSIPCTLYKHLSTLIRQYAQDESNKTTDNLKDLVYKLQNDVNIQKEIKIVQQNEQLPTITTTIDTQKKGWFY